MSSRGSKAKNGHVTTTEYKATHVFSSGAKILVGQDKQHHSLPDFSHTPNRVYVKYDEGKFREMRIYDSEGKAFLEIAHHPEPKLNHGDREHAIWHFHEISEKLAHEDAQLLSNRPDLIEKYKIYLKEVGYYDQCNS